MRILGVCLAGLAGGGPGSPPVVLKLAVDSFGCTHGSPLSGSSSPVARFTSPLSLDLVHSLRSDVDFIVTSSRTVLDDDCSLTVRRGLSYERSAKDGPVRVVADRTMAIRKAEEGGRDELRITKVRGSDPATIVYTEDARCDWDKEGVEVVKVDGLSPAVVLRDLLRRKADCKVMVECGSTMAKAWLPHATTVVVVEAEGRKFGEGVVSWVKDRDQIGLPKASEWKWQGDKVQVYGREWEGETDLSRTQG